MQFNLGAVSLTNFFLGATIVDRAGIRTTDLPLPHQKHCPLGDQALLDAAIDFILATSFGMRALENSKMQNQSVKK